MIRPWNASVRVLVGLGFCVEQVWQLDVDKLLMQCVTKTFDMLGRMLKRSSPAKDGGTTDFLFACVLLGGLYHQIDKNIGHGMCLGKEAMYRRACCIKTRTFAIREAAILLVRQLCGLPFSLNLSAQGAGLACSAGCA